MTEYVIMNRVFSDCTVETFTTSSDAEAIAYFHKKRPDCTDDGGWNLARASEPLKILASTEASDMAADKG
jgi:hypothetical protein